MKNTPHTLPPLVINAFFILGLLSAFAIRALIVVTHLWPALFRPLWYFGVIGYLFFFLYRYAIAEKRKKVIDRYDLLARLNSGETLSAEEREVLIYLLSSIKKSRENLNYLSIFILSILAIAVDLYLSSLAG